MPQQCREMSEHPSHVQRCGVLRSCARQPMSHVPPWMGSSPCLHTFGDPGQARESPAGCIGRADLSEDTDGSSLGATGTIILPMGPIIISIW